MPSLMNLSLYLWAEAIGIASFTQNRSLLSKRFCIIPYEVLIKRKPNVKFFHVFSSRCFILNSNEQRNKFDVKADEGIFLGYSLTSKAYRFLNKKSKKIEEMYYVTFDNSYLKKYQTSDRQSEETIPVTNPMTTPLSNLHEELMNLFDEPEKAISSESKAADNKKDDLKKIIDDAVKDLPNEP